MKFLRIAECKAEVGYRSNTSIYEAVREGLFTRPIPIGKRATAWPDFEVRLINRARIAGKTDDEIRDLVTRLHAERKAQFATFDAVNQLENA